MSDAHDSRTTRIRDAIREVLFRNWDPVNVNSNENLGDEYDGYIDQIHRVLASTPTRETVARELVAIEQASMGMIAPDAEARRRREQTLSPVVEKLLLIDLGPPG